MSPRSVSRILGRLRRLQGEDRGAAVVEFALVLPILMMLVFLCIDGTRAFYTLNSLVSAAREGARWASAQPLTCPEITAAERSVIQDHVIQSAHLFGGAELTPDRVVVYLNSYEGAECQNVRVKIENYPFRPLTPMVTLFGLDSIPMSREAIFRWERAP